MDNSSVSTANVQEADKCTPEYWFLTGAGSKYLAGRAKFWSENYGFTDQKTYTSNNLVTPLIDGAAYMGDLYARLVNLVKGDLVYIVGWQFTESQYLMDKDKFPNELRLLPLLQKLIAAGVDVRVTAYWPPPSLAQKLSGMSRTSAPQGQNQSFVNAIKAAGGSAILDSKLPDAELIPRSHHQKAVVLRSGKDYCAYVGGIDLGNDRWDTPQHVRTQKDFNFYGWHDIQCLVQGDAVRQIWANFVDRWNDQATQQNQPPVAPDQPPPAGTNPGKHHVQVLRTFSWLPNQDKDLFNFTKGGEQTVHEAYVKAIQKAERYIYIEEQFPYYCDLADFIAAQLKAKDNLKVILVLPKGTDMPLSVGKHSMYLRRQFLEIIARGKQYGDPSRVYLYYLRQDPVTVPPSAKVQKIYVHTKLLLIDDRYVGIGSANINKRSMTSDSELQIAIVDGETITVTDQNQTLPVCKFALNLRKTLWAEHLGLNPIQIPDDIGKALALFPKWQPGSKQQVHHLKVLHPEEGRRYKTVGSASIAENFDPDTAAWEPDDDGLEATVVSKAPQPKPEEDYDEEDE